MVEVLIAFMLTAIAIISLLGLQNTGWKSMAKSDYVGRAAEILHNRLETYQYNLANPCNDVTTGDQAEETIRTSGANQTVRGDITYTVNANITQISDNPQGFVVTVRVTWTGNNTGISESLSITRQDIYRFGC